jgi:hypothetical protein
MFWIKTTTAANNQWGAEKKLSFRINRIVQSTKVLL